MTMMQLERPSMNTLQKLTEWLDRGQKEFFTITTPVDADLAVALLERNHGNRQLREKGLRSVAAYKAMMDSGEWLVNGETVKISREGELNDGQHRLWAVVEHGKPVDMTLAFGVTRESRFTVDQGAVRTPGQVMHMLGEIDGNRLAAALHFVWNYDHGKTNTFRERATPLELEKTLNDNPDIREALRAVRNVGKQFRLSTYVAGAYYICQRDGNPVWARDFLDRVIEGVGQSTTSPILALRKRFIDNLTKRGAMTATEQAALFIKAYNATVRGRQVHFLKWTWNGDAPEAFPRVVK